MFARFTHWLGYGLCHQLPERSYFGGGVQAPVCARDTGIYIGFVVALALVAFMHRGERPREFPRAHVWTVMFLLLASMAWDGVTSYAGLRPTTNAIRLATGLATGFAMAPVVLVLLNDILWKRSGSGRVLEPGVRFLAWLAALPATFLVIYLVQPRSGVAFIVFLTVAILATYTLINLVIVGFLPPFDRKAAGLADLLVPALCALALSFVEIALAGQLRVFLEGLSRRL